MTTKTHYTDIASTLPDNILKLLGELTVLFGRLEHMLLLAIKRKSDISLTEAQEIYKHYTMGAKVSGKSCSHTDCPNNSNNPTLRSFIPQLDGLSTICIKLERLTAQRNKIIHGLITTVTEDDGPIVIYRNHVHSIEESFLLPLKDDVIAAIIELNTLIPIPGLAVDLMSSGDLDITYNSSAVSEDDLIVVSVAADNP